MTWTAAHRLTVTGCDIRTARIGVERLHRHHDPPPSALVAFEVRAANGWPIGWATVGRPVAPALQAAGWVEVTRVATPTAAEGAPNACSALYGAAARWARRQRKPITTYTLATESGASLRGAGWIPWSRTRARPPGSVGASWDRPGRPRERRPRTEGRKIRWIPRWAAIGPEIGL